MNGNTKTALITGAAGGIGAELVSTFTNAGYRVIATDRVVMPEYLVCDSYIELDLLTFVRDEDYAADFLSQVREELPEKRLDVLLNNAAIQILGGVSCLSRLDWHATLDINVIAPFLLVQGLIEELEKGHGGVINVGSIHSRQTKENFVAYATSKAAISGMTRAMAVDLGPRFRVNAIEPAAIETEMLRKGFSDKPELYAKLESCHPQRRIGKASEVARLAIAIAEGGFDFLHGACIGLDGGISSKLNEPS